jgi:hypothetical protein
MMIELISHIAKTNGLTQETARQSLGIILNAAERQDSPFATAMFKTIPGARSLSARTGSEVGACTGIIARLIEQTPNGRRHVGQMMIRELQNVGLDHKAIGELLPAVASYMSAQHGMDGFGHLGDLIGTDLDEQMLAAEAA